MKRFESHSVFGAAWSEGTRLALVLILSLLGLANCRKSETASSGRQTAAESPGAERLPKILQSAEPGRAAYFGLRSPRDAAADDLGRLWVADTGNASLAIFDSKGGSLGGWGGAGNGHYSFREHSGVAIGKDRVYVADSWNGRVQAYTLAGEWKASAGGLYAPHGVGVGADGKVWVADTVNHRLLIYGPDLAGEPRLIGKPGEGNAEFSYPIGIAAGPSGSVYVADRGNKRIQVFDSAGAWKASWSFPVSADSLPYLEVDENETIYASDSTHNCVVALSSSGKELRRFLLGDDGQPFLWPSGLALDKKNHRLLVVNTGNSTISRVDLSVKR